MSDVIKTILIMSLSGGIVAVLLFALKPIYRDRIPKSAQYYLWLLVIMSLLLPVSKIVIIQENDRLPIQAPQIISDTVLRHVISVEERRQMSVQNWLYPEYVNNVGTDNTLASNDYLPLVLSFLMAAYPLCVCILLIYYIISYAMFITVCRRRNTAATTEEHAMLNRLHIGKLVPRLYRNLLVTTPMLIGVFRPMILLPDRSYTDEQLSAVLLHELTHLRRKDVFIKWLSVLAFAIHWFNPIVWMVRREISRACELSCDEAVIRRFDTDGKLNYGETLLYIAADTMASHAVLSTTMCEEKKALKERLGAIMKSRRYTHLAVIVSAILIAATCSIAVVLGAGRKTVSKSNYIFDTFIVSDYKLNGYMDDNAISKLTPTDPLDTIDGYDYNFEEIRFDLDDGRCITRFMRNVYDTGIYNMWLQYSDNHPDKREGNNGLAFLGDGDEILRNISQVEDLIGTGEKGWYNWEQQLRYERYPSDNGYGEVMFIYSDGDYNGIMNRLVWVIAEGNFSDIQEKVDGYNLTVLSKLRIPYVGDSSRVGDILQRLPTPDSRLTQRFFSIGDDYGTSPSPYTLTVYYEPRSEDIENASTQYLAHENSYIKNAVILFALIDNLEEVTFAVRDSITSDDGLDQNAYTSYQRLSRHDAATLLDANISDLWKDGSLSVSEAFLKIDEKHPRTPPAQPAVNPHQYID